MRRVTYRRRLMTIIAMGSVVAILSIVEAAAAPADTNPAQPSLKELVQKRAKEGKVAESQLSESAAGGVPEDALNRGVPRSSVSGFLAAAHKRDYVRAAEYLDLRSLPPGMTESQGPELARQLKIVLDRVLWIDPDLVSASPDGDENDTLPLMRDRVGKIAGSEKTHDILLQRVPRGDGVYIWKFAGATVADIPDLYAEFGYGRLESIFPPWFFDVQIMGIEVWFWVSLLSVALLSFPVAMALTAVVLAVRRWIHPASADETATFLRAPLTLLIAVLLTRTVMSLTGLSLMAQALSQAATFVFVALAWMGLRALDLFTQRIARSLESHGLAGAIILMRPAARLLKFVVLVAAGLLWLDNLGYRVTTLLAGISISGFAVALASQKSLENIFGAVTLYTSRTVKVGDFVGFGDKYGTIQEIGLRGTRIRTLDRSVITVSNAEFANMHIENLSVRDRFWYHPRLKLRYETTPEQIRYVLVEVRKMLYAHPKVLSEPLSVRFQGFKDYSLDVDVFAYIDVTDYSESQEVAEDLNLRIMDIVAAAGTDFSVPAQIQYEAPARMLDEEKSKAIERQVGEWRSRQALYLPNFPKEKVAELQGSLDYPPIGSPGAAGGR